MRPWMLAAIISCAVCRRLVGEWLVLAALFMSWLLCLCFSCRVRHVPTCRNERKGLKQGGKAQRGAGIAHPQRSGGQAQRSDFYEGKIMGKPLAPRQGAALSVLSTCVTKQTRDMHYSEAEP